MFLRPQKLDTQSHNSSSFTLSMRTAMSSESIRTLKGHTIYNTIVRPQRPSFRCEGNTYVPKKWNTSLWSPIKITPVVYDEVIDTRNIESLMGQLYLIHFNLYKKYLENINVYGPLITKFYDLRKTKFFFRAPQKGDSAWPTISWVFFFTIQVGTIGIAILSHSIRRLAPRSKFLLEKAF